MRCHGPEKQESGLRLDNAKSWKLGGDTGPAFIAGDSQKSMLVQYVRGDGESVMPPEGPCLSAEQVQTLANWIDRGANWPQDSVKSAGNANSVSLWSFHPIQRPDLASVKRTEWVLNQIDHFVLSRLEQEKIDPAPVADHRTLIRRLSFDLLGLPPTDEDVTAFVEDKGPDAYNRLVDQYLAAPQFGERWARHWLDRTQYAESSGCVIDLPRPYAWRWRDWVVSAINDDLPFDQFTIQQLAGDLLPSATVETRVATGFLRNALTNHEAGIDLEAEHAKTTVDRTSITGAAWLGLTVGCAECHSHKYDPITQRDFYRLYAFFNRLEEQDIDSPTKDASYWLSEARSELERVQAAYVASSANGQDEWETRTKALEDVWHLPSRFDARSLRSLGYAMVHPRADGSMTVDGRVRSKDDHYLTFEPSISMIRAVRVELLAEDDRFHQGPGRSKHGDCILSGISISAMPIDQPTEFRSAKFMFVDSDYCQSGYNPADSLTKTDEDKTKGWAVDHKGLSHAAVFVLDSPLDCSKSKLAIRLHFLTGNGRTPVRFRVAVTDALSERLVGQTVPMDIRGLVAKNVFDRTDSEKAMLKRYFQSLHAPNDEGLNKWNRVLELNALRMQPRGAECIQESWQARKTYVHLRGDFRRLGDGVEPGIPTVFKTYGPSPDNWTRLELAKWIVSPSNPLTARVAVNSLWQSLFGAGLVRTPGDFGRQGEPPTHPELLDWLADEFIREGWSRKEIVRRIVCSATYRQSSLEMETARRDPQNLLLARQNRFRLDAEAVRDCLLHRSGLLLSQFGGPSFRSPQPDDEPTEDWKRDTIVVPAAGMFRRGLYVAIPRTLPDAMLTTFDAPDGAAVCPMRQRTNTPLQAMTLLNDPLFVNAARSLAKVESQQASHDVRNRLEQMWNHCLGRLPITKEIQVLQELYQQLVEEQNSNAADASVLSDVWFVLARTVLNLDEMVTRE